ncbi:MAG: phosphopantetheine-binding protein, partial [Cyanobacteria bacterium P01_F01_bin.3]
PTAYKVLPAFPLTPNGKIDRKALPKITREADAANTRPKTPIENTLANIWQTILPSGEEEKSGKVTVGIHDNFFEIGGHSLLVINAQSQIRQQLGVELSMVDFFRYPTLSTLAAHIARQSQSENLSGQSSGQQQSKERKENRKIAVATGKERLKKRRERQLSQRHSADRSGGKTT